MDVLKTRTKSETLMWRALLGTASALTMSVAMPAMAQTTGGDTAAEEDDTIVVRGIRRSLENAQDIKRDADTFVDAITSEDIGALPDRSVTEALQRVPGIQISRFAAADDPDHFSIEGQGVLVRGLTFVRSELNGRDTFSANNGRALSFADVPAELLGSVQVFKNQTADLIEGGIAGSVNLVTRKPFDKAGQVFAGSIDMNYGDFREEWTPSFSALYSNSWEGDFGRFGILVNGVSSELQTRSDGTQISSFQPRDFGSGPVYAPEGAALRTQDYDRERTGYGGSVQWENPDETVLATAELLRSESTVAWTERVSEIATDNVGDSAFFFLPGTEFGFGSDGLFTNGTISAPTGWRDDQFSGNPRTPIYGLQANNINRGVEQEYVTQDVSFNVKLTPNDRWAFNLDYQFIDSTVKNTDFTLWGSTFQDVTIDISGDIPDVRYQAPNETGDGTTNLVNCSGGVGQNCPSYFDAPNDSFSDPYNSFWRAAMDHFEDSEGQEHAFRADADYDFLDDLGIIKSVRVGARWAERDQTTRFSTYNWGALSEIWGNGGPVWMDEVGAPEGVISNFGWDNFQRGDASRPPSFPYYSGNPGSDYNTAADFADSVVSAWLNGGAPAGGGGGWRRLSERDGLVPGTPYLPGEIADVTETNTAFYVKFDYGHEFDNGVMLSGNFGVRWFNTELVSRGAITFPLASEALPVATGTAPTFDPNDPTFEGGGDNECLAPISIVDGTPRPDFTPSDACNLTPAQRAEIEQFANGASADVSSTNEYDEFLPSFNAKLDIGNGRLFRFAYSKSISRPDVGLLRTSFPVTIATQDDPFTSTSENPNGIGFFGFQTNGGNPFLQPVQADNFDLSYEWYFDDVGSLTVSTFYKSIDGYILGGGGGITLENNGVTRSDVFLAGPANSDETAKVKGFEIAYQQFYDMLPAPWDGFGIQATYTYIDSEPVTTGSALNPTSTTPAGNSPVVDPAELGALPGLSENNVNFAAIYEKGPISTRLVYNWRDEYLVTERDVITPFYPIFQNASGQLDGSFFYTVNEHLKLGVQGANLLNEITETTSYIPNSGGLKGPRSYFQNDRRVTLSARFTF